MFKDFSLSFLAIFVAMDIIGVLPLFLTLTHELQGNPNRKEELDSLVRQSMTVAFTVAIVFLLIGQELFHYLGITLADFRIAGGIVLLLMALADLVGGPETGKRLSGSTGVVPIGVPLITGPGVLTALVLQVGSHGYWVTGLAAFLNYIFAWVVLKKSNLITRAIGRDGTVVVSKIAALLLAAISVGMIRSGVFEFVKAGVR